VRRVRIEAPRGERLTPGTYEDASSIDSRRPEDPWISVTFGSNEERGTGRFTIFHIDEGRFVSSVWFTYEFRSVHGDRVFGEARVSIAVPEPALLVTPGRVSWPDEYPGSTSPPVPVTLTAQGDAPVVVEDAAVTAGASEFAIAGTDCTVLEPGQSCQVDVVFTPSSPGLRTGTVTISDSTSADHTVTVSGRGIPGVTSWTLDSPPDDGMGGDGHAEVESTAYDMNASGTPTRLSFSFAPRQPMTGASDFVSGTADFVTDAEHPFVAGETFTGSDQPGGVPQMAVQLNGFGCSPRTWQFTVREAAYARELLRAAEIDFEQKCDAAVGVLTGTIRWRAEQTPDPPPPPGDVTAPDAVTGLRVTSDEFEPFMLEWESPTSPDWAQVIVRGTPGSTPPQGPEDGYAVYRGRDPLGHVNELAMAGEHSFSVFTRDLVGNLSEPATITVPDIVPPAPVTGLYVDVTGDTAMLAWDEPTSPDWDHAYVNVNLYPGGPVDWQVLEVGRDHSVTITGIDGQGDAGFSVGFAVYLVDTVGNVSRVAAVGAVPTTSTISASKARVACGERAMITGDLEEPQQPWAHFWRAITLQSREGPEQPWTDEQVQDGSMYGDFRFGVFPCSNTEYRIRYDGEWHHLGTTSDPVQVLAAPFVKLSAPRTRGPVGTRFSLGVISRPANESVQLQRRIETRWRTVSTGRTDAEGRVRFSVRPRNPGRLDYRALSPATETRAKGVSDTLSIRVR
jgi:hypothetical protein